MGEVANRDRFLVAAVRALAAERSIECQSFCHDWVLRLEKGGRVSHVVGFHFELGPATAPLIAGDKAATAALLGRAGLPRVEHRLLLHPREVGYVGADGNWGSTLAWAETRGFQLVVKPNDGTGGHDVTRVSSALELEKTVHRLFEKHRALALSPWLEIAAEFRVVMLQGEPRLVYRKLRPAVVGDGLSSLAALILAQRGPEGFEGADLRAGELAGVPAEGETVLLRWKHNLGAGSSPQDLAAGPLAERVVDLARRATHALGVELASVDLVEVGDQLSVLELNSGIMLEAYARQSHAAAAAGKRIYEEILRRIFG